MGAAVILTARSEERLNETLLLMDGEGHCVITADLLDDTQLEQLIKKIPDIDGVVLCSGKGLTLPMQFASRCKMDDIFNTNFFCSF